MRHIAPESVPPLFARSPDADPPQNDAAPSGNGASVKRSKTSPDSKLARRSTRYGKLQAVRFDVLQQRLMQDRTTMTPAASGDAIKAEGGLK